MKYLTEEEAVALIKADRVVMMKPEGYGYWFPFTCFKEKAEALLAGKNCLYKENNEAFMEGYVRYVREGNTPGFKQLLAFRAGYQYASMDV